MKIGSVLGGIWCTSKEESLAGLKLTRVRLLEESNDASNTGSVVIAADIIGAGIGEKVLLTSGSSVHKHERLQNTPIDMAIIGIIDPENDSLGQEFA